MGKVFGAELRRLRRAADVTQAELGNRLGGKSHVYVSQLERGHKNPSAATAYRIARELGADKDQADAVSLLALRERKSVRIDLADLTPLGVRAVLGVAERLDAGTLTPGLCRAILTALNRRRERPRTSRRPKE